MPRATKKKATKKKAPSTAMKTQLLLPLVELTPGSPGKISPVGLVITARTSWPEYERMAETLQASSLRVAAGVETVQWAVADLLRQAERDHGEKYSQLAVPFERCWSPGTLARMVSLAEAFAIGRRRAFPLTFAHHQEVKALAPAQQDRLLDRAANEGWSAKQLRQAAQQVKLGAGEDGVTVSFTARACACCAETCKAEGCRCAKRRGDHDDEPEGR